MFRTDQASASALLPSPAAAGTPGYFTDGDPAHGVAGTIVDNDWLNMIQEEILSVLMAASISPSKSTYNQLLAAINAIVAGSGTNYYGTDTGTANAAVATLAPVPASYAAITGLTVKILKEAGANTGAYTVNLNGLGVKNVIYQGSALTAGMLAASSIFEISYDGTQFQLLSAGAILSPALLASRAEALAGTDAAKALTADASAQAVQAGGYSWAATAGGSATVLTASLTPAPASLAAGTKIHLIPAAQSTGPATLALNGGSAIAIQHNGDALVYGELNTGCPAELLYDGTHWQLLNPQPLEASVSYNPGTLPNGGQENVSMTVTGARMGDFVELSFSNSFPIIQWRGYVSANDTVNIQINQNSGGSVTPGAGTLRARVKHHA